ncbi:hypothetical protein PHLGIDRAFT_17830 [Phlebiopsis gigantea 11061_1 CR5-6]|uniref:MYND-type domain-containing protein n=1 Tax=Phlebiopsis gigantea (strain 11061_1 CR5-6) TaxID=745531 RepID=A0A0C3SDH1_PHLG1|nr:hypothetical protein PHLGIDRAFT_17830 [Phlebiopsis gigantea 11061_1 CR5-6]
MAAAAAFGPPPIHVTNVREDGVGIDLIDYTNRAYSTAGAESRSSKAARAAAYHDSAALQQLPKATREYLQRVGKIGISCERLHCHNVHLPGQKLVFKRCARCISVCYCSTECQREDWKRHKPYCFEARSTQAKDSWLRYARYVLANPVLRVMIKSYARTVLKLDTDRLAGMRNRLVLTCTSIPDCTRGAGRIFQIARADFEPTPVEFETNKAIIDEEGPDLFAVQIMFKFDVPGYNGTYHAVECISPGLLKMVPPYPTPIFALAALNKAIRDDAENSYKLRISS